MAKKILYDALEAESLTPATEAEYQTAEEVHQRACAAVGKSFGEIDRTGRLAGNKSDFGLVMEESWFGYKVNSRAEPDFKEAGVELKVTPFVRNKRGDVSAKERLVLNIINYMLENLQVFEDSSFWRKNARLEMIFYEYRNGISRHEMVIEKALLYSYPEEDLEVIKKDWMTIVGKINAGRAHEISESDTIFLGACTKGVDRSSLRQQPHSSVLAMQRAYCFKQSYMTSLLRNYVFGGHQDERIIKSPKQVAATGFEGYVQKKLKPYYGKSQADLCRELKVESQAKNANELLLGKMLGIQGKISQSYEFSAANIVPKTIRVNADNSINESMSFPAFKFKELVQETWEDSRLRDMFESTRFLFVVFKFDGDKNLIFKGIKFWNIPYKDLEGEVRKVWQRTFNTLRMGVVLTPVNNRVYNNLSKEAESPVAHVRPHARNSQDTDELPDGRKMTKQCFWLNKEYVLKQIEDII